VDDSAVAGHLGCQALDVAGDVARHDIRAEGRQRLTPSGISDEGGNLVASGSQLPYDRPPDEPGAARHEHSGHIELRESAPFGAALSRSECRGRCSPARP
jgi:hypothetical protein